MNKQLLCIYVGLLYIINTNAQDSISASADKNSSQTVSILPNTIPDSINPTPEDIHLSNTVTDEANNVSPYTTSFKKDGPIIIAGVGLTGLGVALIQNKKDLTMEQLNRKTKDNVPFFDRGNVGYYSKKLNDDSYLPFQASFAIPVVMSLINKNERSKFGQVMVLYTETMAITGALFTIAAGSIQRSRPFVYNTELPLNDRLSGNNQRSFYAGHTAATAAATFFAAKVFQDFNPQSALKPFIWGVAAAIPAYVGYLRYKAGYHFLSDNILGYLLGAGAGILVPHLHKNKIKNVNISAQSGDGFQEISLTWHF